MLASEKRKLEQEEIKNSRKIHILECAYNLFSNGIESITMNDIAKNAEIGVASLYRYFMTKDSLAIECARYLWAMEQSKLSREFVNEKYNSLNGYEQIEVLLSLFPKFFTTEQQFFRFIYYFDAFIKTQNIPSEQLSSYELTISNSKKLLMEAIKKGVGDESIVIYDASPEEIYFTLTHSLFSLAQKLSLTSEMLSMDKAISTQKQMELLTKLLLSSIKRINK